MSGIPYILSEKGKKILWGAGDDVEWAAVEW